MKTIYFAILFLCFGSLVKAQPIITQANYPAAGSNYPAKVFYGASWLPGSNGSNKSWDFTSMPADNFANVPFSYNVPSSTGNFSSSDIELAVALQYSYFLSSSTAFQISGTSTSFPTTITRAYTNPQKIITFPFTYENNFKDTAKTAKYNFSSGKQMRTIHSETKADAYGDVKLPDETIYNNVLRLRITTETIDSNYNSSDVYIGRDISIDTNYYWISPNHKPHLFVLSKSIQNGGTPTIIAQYFTSPTVLSTVEESYSSYFNLYPNPLSNQLSIEVDDDLLKTKQNLKFTLLNNKGVEVMSSPINTNKIILQKDNLSSGLYYYKITSKQVVLSTGKLTVQ